MGLKIELSPEEAWRPFEPSDNTPFDRRAAAHLFRRAGFGANLPALEQAIKRGPQPAVKELVEGGPERVPFDAQMDSMVQSVLAANNPEGLASWWLYRMRHTPSPLVEKTTLFWHGHFATSAAKVDKAALLYRQNKLLREHALGSFEAMLQGISRDPAMLLYLDSATNRKTHPNENFAREILELFCLGPGHYSEKDIQQLARCFTGWEIQYGEFKFNRYQHDYGTKTLFGERGEWDGDAAIGVILKQPAAAEFLCTKLVRFFVADELNSPELIAPLAKQLREKNYTIAPVLQTILGSRLFFDSQVRGAKVRSPVELGVGLLRSLDATSNMNTLVEQLRNIGQLPLYPPNVKGWNGGREWINAATIVGRANLARRMVEDNETRFGGGPLEAYLARFDLRDAPVIVDRLCELLLPLNPPGEVRQQWIALLDEPGERRETRLRRLLHAMSASPEFQLS